MVIRSLPSDISPIRRESILCAAIPSYSVVENQWKALYSMTGIQTRVNFADSEWVIQVFTVSRLRCDKPRLQMTTLNIN